MNIAEVLSAALKHAAQSLSWAERFGTGLSTDATGKLSRLRKVIRECINDVEGGLVPPDASGQMLLIKDLAEKLDCHPGHVLRKHSPTPLAREGNTALYAPGCITTPPESPPPQDSRPPEDRIDRQVNSAPISVRGMSDVREKNAPETPLNSV